jgi:hypothetical protein
MKNYALILLTVTSLSGMRALADAPDVGAPPATAPSAVAPAAIDAAPATAPAAGVAPTTDPASIGIAAALDAANQPATTQPLAAQSPATAPSDALAATEPSTQPTTQPFATTDPTTLPAVADAAVTPAPSDTRYSPGVYRPLPRILSAEYAILAERSIFKKGSKVVIERLPPPPPKPPTAGGETPFTIVEQSLVFDGTTEAGIQFFAWLEDRTTSKMTMVQDGDKVADGNITDISLDALDYTSTKGHVIHVLVGQNLRGEEAPPAADSIAVAPALPPTTQGSAAVAGAPPVVSPGTPGTPPPAGTTPAASGASGDGTLSVLEKLKRRRAAELGQ